MPDRYYRYYNETPRPIVHDGINISEGYGRIYTFALAPMNKYLLDRERRLFLYYATCKQGFAPAEKEIERQTRIRDGKLYEFRIALAQKGFISYEEDRSKGDLAIHVRWDNIWRMAERLREDDRQRELDKKKCSKKSKSSKRREQAPPAKLAGITDNLYNEGTYQPIIGELNRTMKKRYEDPDAPVETADLSDSNLRFIKALENLTEDQASRIIDDWYLGQIPC